MTATSALPPKNALMPCSTAAWTRRDFVRGGMKMRGSATPSMRQHLRGSVRRPAICLVLRLCDGVRLRHRQQHADGCSFAGFALGFDGSAVQLDDVLDDGKTKAGSPELTAARLIRPIEALEDSRQIGFRNAHTFVGHANAHPLPLDFGSQKNGSARL